MRTALAIVALLAAAPAAAQQPPPRPATPAPAATPAHPAPTSAAPARPAPVTPAVPPPGNQLPLLPDTSGWGIHVLALDRGPDGSLWVGTYEQGIFVLRPGAATWEHLMPSSDTARHAVGSSFVHAFAFQGRDVWYGSIGDGYGVSHDNGRSWRNWGGRELGRRWRYVAPNGIVVREDTVFIGTADGIRWSANRGESWHEITDSTVGGLPSRYVLAIALARGDGLWISTLRGTGEWHHNAFQLEDPPATPALGARIRSVFVYVAPKAVVPANLGSDRCIGSLRPERKARHEDAHWECMALFVRAGGAAIREFAGCEHVMCAAATSIGAMYGSRLGLVLQPRTGTARSRDVYSVLTPPEGQQGDTLFGTACGIIGQQPAACLQDGDTTGVRAPEPPRRPWLGRPIALTDNPFNDQTYRWGSTMGNTISVQHQGIDINEPAGTSVHAIDAGTVVWSGPGEQQANVVAIRHDSMLTTPSGRFYLFSVYYHNSALLVHVGQHVTRGQVISRVGSTGRATNEHLHLEVHASPVDSVQLIVDPKSVYLPYTRNPELWIEPLPGMGVVAGQVWDRGGRPVQQARIYGLVKPEPQETPLSYVETYGEHARPDPTYGEHFAITDVPPGEYVLGTTIDGQRVFRRIRVEAGKVTWVEFRP